MRFVFFQRTAPTRPRNSAPADIGALRPWTREGCRPTSAQQLQLRQILCVLFPFVPEVGPRLSTGPLLVAHVCDWNGPSEKLAGGTFSVAIGWSIPNFYLGVTWEPGAL